MPHGISKTPRAMKMFENAKLNEDAEQTYFKTMAALAMAVEAGIPAGCSL